MGNETVHPAQLVGVFFRRRRVAVGQVQRGDTHHAIAVGHQGFDVAGVLVAFVARQAAHHLDRALRKNGDAVEGLLAVGLDIVAGGFDFEARESVIRALEFLETHDIRRHLPQIVQEMVCPLADGVDVPGGDAHGSFRVVGTASLARGAGAYQPHRRCAHIHCSGRARIERSSAA